MEAASPLFILGKPPQGFSSFFAAWPKPGTADARINSNCRSQQPYGVQVMFSALSDASIVLFYMIPAMLALAIPIVAIWTGHQRRIREVEARHRERLAAIEKGLPIPPDDPVVPPVRTGSPLLRGLVWLGVGLALVYGDVNWQLSRIGWIPAAIGAAYLIFYTIESLKRPSAPSA
jgi:hypothetical protein